MKLQKIAHYPNNSKALISYFLVNFNFNFIYLCRGAKRSYFLFFDSIRALYGTDNQRNAVHGSDSIEAALREIHFFFPDGQ